MSQKFSLNVNGKAQTVDVDPDMPLLYALRNDCELKGAKFGCGLAQCGACTVVMDGAAIRSCRTPVRAAAGRNIVTLEGIGLVLLQTTWERRSQPARVSRIATRWGPRSRLLRPAPSRG